MAVEIDDGSHLHSTGDQWRRTFKSQRRKIPSVGEGTSRGPKKVMLQKGG